MMFIQSWGEFFNGSLMDLWGGFIHFVPSLLGALILFIIGWVVASVIGKAVAQVLNALKLDKLFESAGAAVTFVAVGLLVSAEDVNEVPK